VIRSRSLSVLFLTIVLTTLAGCRPDSTDPGDGTSANAIVAARNGVDAETRLREVFRRYQSSSYYADDGRVVLQGPDPSNVRALQTEAAPLRVYLDQRELLVNAYTARIRVVIPSPTPSGPQSGRVQSANNNTIEMIAWFDEPESSHFDAQVLRQRWQPTPESRIRLDRVLADEVLRSRLSAGVAGPPPQLEWLLADRPMEKLFDSRSRFEWLAPASIEQTSLHRIAVTSRRERFVFWIDPSSSLIRRVELPVPELITASTPSDAGQWSLRLELDGATFQPPQTNSNDAPSFDSQPSFEPKLVRQFVPLPPPPPSQLLGKRINLQRLAQSLPSNHPIGLEQLQTLLIAMPPSAPEKLTAWIQAWQQSLPAFAAPGLGPTRVFVITDDRLTLDSLRSLPASMVTPIDPRRVTDLTRPMRLGESAFGLLAQPSQLRNTGVVLMTENSTTPGTLAAALAAIRDFHSGVDIPSKMRTDYESIVRDYEKRLTEVSRNHP